ncbi:MAG: outer membrane protein assembly factor BamC [Betaproteobacteria bacterium]|nr:outer membrane protein assembly factor BamC [Betaproteobacteria bacterium]
MPRRLMIRFGPRKNGQPPHWRRHRSCPAERAKIVRASDGAQTLEVQERFDRAWRRVGLAIDRVGFTAEDRDWLQGTLFRSLCRSRSRLDFEERQ